jgi:hypothetical protein
MDDEKRAKARERAKQYYLSNRTKCLEASRRWCAKNADRVLAYGRAWRASNRERARDSKRKSREKNRDAYNAKRRVLRAITPRTEEQKAKARTATKEWNAKHPGRRMEYYLAHRKEIAAKSLAKRREYRAAHPLTPKPKQDPEIRKAREKARREATREIRLAEGRAARAANPEKYREIERRTRNANPDKQKAKWQFRRARKRDSKAKRLTPEQRLTLYSTRTCYLCGKDFRPGDRTSVDHIVPLAGGGPHVFENLALTHFSCNSRKGAKSFSHSC